MANPLFRNKFWIVNIYNETTTTTLPDLRELIGGLSSADDLLIFGDFNLHNPLWSDRRNYRGLTNARFLLTLIEDLDLQLLTRRGTVTHRWNGGELTIDLTFVLEEVASRTIHCKVDLSLDCDSDHLPVSTALDWKWQPAAPTGKRSWAKTNLPLLRQTYRYSDKP